MQNTKNVAFAVKLANSWDLKAPESKIKKMK